MKALVAIVLAGVALGPGSQRFETEGVCSIDEKGASCWNLQGSVLPELSSDIDRRVRALPYGLSFVPGRKNRFIVVRTGEFASFGASNRMQVQTYALPSDPGSTRMLLRVTEPPEATVSSATFNLGLYQGAPVEMPLREGAKATIGGVGIEIGPIGRNPNFRNDFGGFGSRWVFAGGPWRVAIDRTGQGSGDGVTFEAIGRDGKPIHFVDLEGKPISDAKFEASKPDPTKPFDFSRVSRYSNAYLGNLAGLGYESPLAALWTYTNIDPKSIAKLRVRRIVNGVETIGPFPLDPVQANVP